MPDNRRGRLLVAAPALVDPNFHRAVVLLLEHSADGALGVVLNRPTELSAREALPGPLGDALPEDELVHRGGPVQPDAVIVLADFDDPSLAAGVACGTVGIVDPEGDMEALAGATRAMRAFGGYAGWTAGQLEQEIAEEAWVDAVCLPSDVFTTAPESLWATVLDRKGGSWKLVARMPPDPSLN